MKYDIKNDAELQSTKMTTNHKFLISLILIFKVFLTFCFKNKKLTTTNASFRWRAKIDTLFNLSRHDGTTEMTANDTQLNFI